jgi:hypothetical protein
VLVLFLVLAGAVEVESGSPCPRAVDVAQKVAALLPAASKTVPDRARIERTGDRLQLELRRADGTPVAWRRLDAHAACEELAEAAAVMIATWETDLEAGRPLPPPDFDRDAPVVAVDAAPIAAPRGRMRWELGAGFTASVASGVMLPGVMIEAVVAPHGPWAARLTMVATESAEQPFGMGIARWNRLMFAAGPSWRGWLLDLHAELVAALVHVEGLGYDSTHDEYGFDPGLGAGVRLALRPAPLVPWIGASAVGWLHREELQVVGVPGQVSLPDFDVLLSIGISFGRAP